MQGWVRKAQWGGCRLSSHKAISFRGSPGSVTPQDCGAELGEAVSDELILNACAGGGEPERRLNLTGRRLRMELCSEEMRGTA